MSAIPYHTGAQPDDPLKNIIQLIVPSPAVDPVIASGLLLIEKQVETVNINTLVVDVIEGILTLLVMNSSLTTEGLLHILDNTTGDSYVESLCEEIGDSETVEVWDVFGSYVELVERLFKLWKLPIENFYRSYVLSNPHKVPEAVYSVTLSDSELTLSKDSFMVMVEFD